MNVTIDPTDSFRRFTLNRNYQCPLCSRCCRQK